MFIKIQVVNWTSNSECYLIKAHNNELCSGFKKRSHLENVMQDSIYTMHMKTIVNIHT